MNNKLIGAYTAWRSPTRKIWPVRRAATSLRTNVSGEIHWPTQGSRRHDAIDGNNLNLTLDENVRVSWKSALTALGPPSPSTAAAALS